MIGIVFAVEGLASLHASQSQMQHAARLFAWANSKRAELGDPRPPVEQASVERDVEVIQSHLNAPDLARFSSEGSRLTVEEAIALALED